MSCIITLQWRNFSAQLEKVNAYYRANLSSAYDGLLASPENLQVIFKSPFTEDDSLKATSYWESITPSSFAPSISEIIQAKINASITFGNKVIVEAATGNVIAGITQAGKTREASDFLAKLERYLRSGSLYAAMQEIDDLIANGIPDDLTAFITPDRLTAVRTQIATFLGQ